MKILTVNYQKTFNLQNYSSERIGMEASVDEYEDAATVMRTLKDNVEEIHVKNNPQLYEFTGRDEVFMNQIIPKTPTELKSKPKFTNTTDSIIYDIEHCPDEKELKTYQTLASTNEKIKEAYYNRLKSLQ